ncbi:hypothetical protein Bbelb_447020 [Branchiostoma belcheri]|nr:hypothetical protein Bbelb_447020 [Branchiostoma belcheri]
MLPLNFVITGYHRSPSDLTVFDYQTPTSGVAEVSFPGKEEYRPFDVSSSTLAQTMFGEGRFFKGPVNKLVARLTVTPVMFQQVETSVNTPGFTDDSSNVDLLTFPPLFPTA